MQASTSASIYHHVLPAEGSELAYPQMKKKNKKNMKPPHATYPPGSRAIIYTGFPGSFVRSSFLSKS